MLLIPMFAAILLHAMSMDDVDDEGAEPPISRQVSIPSSPDVVLRSCRDDARRPITRQQVDLILRTSKNFAGKKLVDLNLSGIEIRDANFDGALFCGVDFSNSSLINVKMGYSGNISESESGLPTKGAKFIGCKFKNTDFMRSYGEGIQYDMKRGKGIDPRYFLFIDCEFINSTFSSVYANTRGELFEDMMDGPGISALRCTFNGTKIVNISRGLFKESNIRNSSYTGGYMRFTNSTIDSSSFRSGTTECLSSNFSWSEFSNVSFLLSEGVNQLKRLSFEKGEIGGEVFESDTFRRMLICGTTISAKDIEIANGADSLMLELQRERPRCGINEVKNDSEMNEIGEISINLSFLVRLRKLDSVYTLSHGAQAKSLQNLDLTSDDRTRIAASPFEYFIRDTKTLVPRYYARLRKRFIHGSIGDTAEVFLEYGKLCFRATGEFSRNRLIANMQRDDIENAKQLLRRFHQANLVYKSSHRVFSENLSQIGGDSIMHSTLKSGLDFHNHTFSYYIKIGPDRNPIYYARLIRNMPYGKSGDLIVFKNQSGQYTYSTQGKVSL